MRHKQPQRAYAESILRGSPAVVKFLCRGASGPLQALCRTTAGPLQVHWALSVPLGATRSLPSRTEGRPTPRPQAGAPGVVHGTLACCADSWYALGHYSVAAGEQPGAGEQLGAGDWPDTGRTLAGAPGQRRGGWRGRVWEACIASVPAAYSMRVRPRLYSTL